MRVVSVCVLACAIPLNVAQARPRAPVLAPECNVSMSCDVTLVEPSRRQAKRHWHQSYASAPPNEPIAEELTASGSVSMAGVVPELAAKVAQIQSACPG